MQDLTDVTCMFLTFRVATVPPTFSYGIFFRLWNWILDLITGLAEAKLRMCGKGTGVAFLPGTRFSTSHRYPVSSLYHLVSPLWLRNIPRLHASLFLHSFAFYLTLSYSRQYIVVRSVITCGRISPVFYVFFSDAGGSVSVPSGASGSLFVDEFGWKCDDRGVVVPSSQNSTSPSAPSVPRLTRLPLSRMMSSMVTRLSENIWSESGLPKL